jgi:ComF family protein
MFAEVFARRCALCGLAAGNLNICAGCFADLPWIRHGCDQCGRPLPANVSTGVCARCLGGVARAFRSASALIYEYPVDCMVTGAKFRGRMELAYGLGELLACWVDQKQRSGHLDLPDVLLPVPLHRRRLASRGFNQAAEISRPVGHMLGLPVRPHLCRRVRDSPAQTTLDERDRLRNMRGAFRAAGELGGARVAVIDDVITTGSTAAACAAALFAVGVAEVQVWSAARTVGLSRRRVSSREK